MFKQLNKANYDEAVTSAAACAVLFWFAGSAPDLRMYDEVDSVTDTFPSAEWYAVEIDGSDAICALEERLNVTCCPYLILYRDGSIVARIRGYIPKHQLAGQIADALNGT